MSINFADHKIKCRRCQVGTNAEKVDSSTYSIRCRSCGVEVVLHRPQGVGLRQSDSLVIHEFDQFLRSIHPTSEALLKAVHYSVPKPVDPRNIFFSD